MKTNEMPRNIEESGGVKEGWESTDFKNQKFKRTAEKQKSIKFYCLLEEHRLN